MVEEFAPSIEEDVDAPAVHSYRASIYT